MSELRIFVRYEPDEDRPVFAWAQLDGRGHLQQTGASLEQIPKERLCRLVLAGETVLSVGSQIPKGLGNKQGNFFANLAEPSTMEAAEALHVVPQGASKSLERTLSITSKSHFKKALAELRRLDLHPRSAVPEYLLLPWEKESWSVLLNEEGCSVRFSEFDGLAIDRGDPPAGLKLALQQRHAPQRIRLFQGNAIQTPDPTHWQTQLGVPVVSEGAWHWRETPWNDAINLLTGTFTAAPGGIDWQSLQKPVWLGLAALLSLQIAGLSISAISQSLEKNRLQGEIERLARAALPKSAALVDAPWQLREKLRSLRSTASEDSAMPLLSRAGQYWPAENSPATPKSLRYQGRGLEITLPQADDAWLAQYQDIASSMGLATRHDKKPNGEVILSIRPATASPGARQP